MLKNVYSLDGLLLKKKDLQVIKVINILRIFSSLRFFKVDYYPFDYNKFLCFYNNLIKYIIFKKYLVHLKGVHFYFLNIFLKNKNLRKKWGPEIRIFLKRYKKFVLKIFKNRFINDLNYFLKMKFRFKKLKKVRYLEKHDFNSNNVNVKKQVKQDNTKMNFFSNLLKKKNLRIIHHYLKYRHSKTLKKKRLYLKKKKENTKYFVQKKLSDSILFKKIYKKVRKKKKFLFRKLRIQIKGKKKKFEERQQIAAKWFKLLSKNDKKIKRVLKKRKKKFWRKYILIKKYKRIMFRRKKRTGILHFRMFYSNYYVTLTDLSHNVIYSCSAGSVSDTNNKKTKMSNVVSMPIFFRILFFFKII